LLRAAPEEAEALAFIDEIMAADESGR